MTLFFAAEFGGAFEVEIFVDGVAGLIIAGALWWLYFVEEKRLTHVTHLRTTIFTYLHLPFYFCVAMIGVGLAAELDVLQSILLVGSEAIHAASAVHGEGGSHAAAAEFSTLLMINWAIAGALVSLWFIRDILLDHRHHSAMMLAGTALFVAFGLWAVPIWGSALGLLMVLLARLIDRLSQKVIS